MQGRKELIPKFLYSISLPELVPPGNFYRKLQQTLDLHFLRAATASYYGSEGQESIDPVVFFKILIVGYLNNINSDRRLIEYCADSLSIRLFLGYDIDEALPWHSTISRTRQLYSEEVFLSLFQKVLSQCVAKGMVRGKRQAIDSAFIKANASMDSLLEKEVAADAAEYVSELNKHSEFQVSIQKKTKNKEEQTETEVAVEMETVALVETEVAVESPVLVEAETEEEAGKALKNCIQIAQADDQENSAAPQKRNNTTHYSNTDPDARISVKPGKACQLNYYGQIAVDDAHHVITAAMADFASKRDSDCLPDILGQTIANLASNDLQAEQILADTNYSSGHALRYCEENNIDAYIPNFGAYQPAREWFLFNKEQNQYECQRGNKAILPFKVTKSNSHVYRSSQTICKSCPFHESCCSKSMKYKEIRDSVDKPYYDRMHAKLKTGHTARIMRRIRSGTVEPVLGTLINHRNMKRVNTRGIHQANKHVLMAAMSYNLKKLLNFTSKQLKAIAKAMPTPWDKAFFTQIGLHHGRPVLNVAF